MKKHIPNALSIVRLLLTGILALLIFIPHPLLWAQIIVVAAIVSDKLDGTLARLWKVESELGKKLESLVDPSLSLVAGVYITIQLDYPAELLIFGLVVCVIGVGGRAFFMYKTKKLFYKKSHITRYGVGFLYVIFIFYIFQIPYRHILLGPLVGYACIGAFNYMRLIAIELRKHRLTQRLMKDSSPDS